MARPKQNSNVIYRLLVKKPPRPGSFVVWNSKPLEVNKRTYGDNLIEVVAFKRQEVIYRA